MVCDKRGIMDYYIKERTDRKALFCGDLHGRWDLLNWLLNRKNYPDLCIVAGDFGAWAPYNGQRDIVVAGEVFEQCGIKNKNTRIYFCPGNHEHWDWLDGLTSNEICSGVFYMPKGSILEINNKPFLLMGGAESIDKQNRTQGVDWFPQEIITMGDIYRLPETSICGVVSHTGPHIFLDNRKPGEYYGKFKDPSMDMLDIVFEMYNPKRWIFGHWHQRIYSTTNGCKWDLLDMAWHNRQWWLEEYV